MFYLSGNKRGNLLGVVDTKDNVEEFYAKEYLLSLNIEIIRLNKELEIGFKFKTKCFEFTLIEVNNILGWKLKALGGITVFKNKPCYLGYPVISLEGCFQQYKEKEINVRDMITSNVINMSYMFSSCFNLTSLDLDNFTTSNVINMSHMFCYCESLIFLDLSNFNTSNVTDMRYMFHNCKRLTSLDLSNFDTRNVVSMLNMFSYCQSLTSLDLSCFNTCNITYMEHTFNHCESLAFLDLSNFNMDKVTATSGLFFSCNSLIGAKIGNSIKLYELFLDYRGFNIYLFVPKSLCISCKELNIENLNLNIENFSTLIAKLKLSGNKDMVFSY